MRLRFTFFFLFLLPAVFLISSAHVFSYAQTVDPLRTSTPPATDNTSQKNKTSRNKAKTADRPPISVDRSVQIVYGRPAWNRDSQKIDSSTIFVRETETHKLAQVRIDETAPDSSIFKGEFTISWDKTKAITPEIFVSENDLTDGKELTAFINQVQLKKVKRRPFVLRMTDQGEQLLDVYDTREQAVAALTAYRAQEKLKRQTNSEISPTRIIKESVLETEKLAQKKSQEIAQALAAAQRQAERVRLEQLEQQRAEERRRKLEALQQAEIVSRRQQAAKIVQRAMVAYQAGNFKTAEELFTQSLELDPQNTSYYFRYGVALYKNQKFDLSLVILKRAAVDGTQGIERDFYVGLNHYRLEEFNEALAAFAKTRATGQKPIAPSAAFYEGLILFDRDSYDKAQESFQYVLDQSSDAKLDERAEAYIEKIIRIKNFQANQAQKILLEFSVGGIYDGNVLQQSGSSADLGIVTNTASPRAMMNGSLEYRPIYQIHHEASLKTSVSTIYTSDVSLATTDHLLLSAAAPYKYKGTVGEYGYQFSLEPIFEHLQIPVGSPLLDSAVLNMDNSLIVSPNWFSNYRLTIRKDNALTAPISADDDLTALKLSLTTDQTFFTDRAQQTAILSRLGVSANNAEGKNTSYQRIDLGLGYTRPWRWDISWTGRLDLYHLTYHRRDIVRSDLNTAISLSLDQKINDGSSWGASLGYSTNDSNDGLYTYQKPVLSLIYSAKTGF